ncbi:hypothetical protein [Spirosoma validum]|uniref:Uncharacterized protein n=1 Tax=Spirosoma validum TaxID=2771355 RepID=A0A927B851_9BACT|nr:hypothetical protein [Spirosoma validum]MBD2757033.1 hypothetical protein [Spirosoma validum]
MKAQLTFLSVFMKVLMMLLILALCLTGSPQQESASTEAQQSLGTLSIENVTQALLNSVKSLRYE